MSTQELGSRKEAINSRNGVDYVLICDEEGIEPELPDLHEKGLADLVWQEMKKSKQNKQQHVLKEKEFLVRAEELNIDDFYAHPDAKKMFLQDYFPGRFGHGKKQDISNYDPAQIGALFKGVYNNYKKKHT